MRVALNLCDIAGITALSTALTACKPRPTGTQEEQPQDPFARFEGVWTLEKHFEVGQVTRWDGFKFIPQPPQSFKFECDPIGFFEIEGLERYTANDIREIPEIEADVYHGNNGVYFYSINLNESPPLLLLQVPLDGTNLDTLKDLAIYRRTEPRDDETR